MNPFSKLLDKLFNLIDRTAKPPEISEEELERSKKYFEDAAKQQEERKMLRGNTYRYISLIVSVVFMGVWLWLSIKQEAMYEPPDKLVLMIGSMLTGTLFKSKIDKPAG